MESVGVKSTPCLELQTRRSDDEFARALAALGLVTGCLRID